MPRLRYLLLGSLLVPSLVQAESRAGASSADAGGASDASRWGGVDQPYLQQAHERIHRRWSGFLRELQRMPADSPYTNPSLSVEMGLTVEPDGAISRVELRRPSGLKGFDDAPGDMLHDVGALPPPPPALHSDDGRTYLTWRFRRKEPGCEESLVVERRLSIEEALPRLVADGQVARAAQRIVETVATEPARQNALLAVFAGALGRSAAASPDGATRVLAVPVMLALDDGESYLGRLAVDPDPRVRRATLEALGARARCASCRDLLVEALTTEQCDAAAKALAARGDKSALPPLRALLETGAAPEEAATALALLGDREDAIRIAARLLGASPASRVAGAIAARVLADPSLAAALEAALTGAPEDLRVVVMSALATCGARAARTEAHKLLLRSAGHDPSVRVRASALEALGTLGDKSAATRHRLVEDLENPEPGLRAAAAASAVRLMGEQVKDDLARSSHDKSPLVRAALARAIVQHPFEGSKLLVAHLEHDADPSVREAFAAHPPAAPPVAEPTRASAELLHATDTPTALRASAVWLTARLH